MVTAAILEKTTAGLIHSVHVSFILAAVLARIGFILSLGIKDDPED